MAEWTWLVYMAGDNNLEGAGLVDLREMQKAGSTTDVNIVVQFDTERQKTMRYLVERRKLNTLQTMHGVDCGDPNVLSDFIQWGTRHFPAKRYALIVWNHGGGWEDVDVDYAANRTLKPRLALRSHRARRTLFRTTRDQIARRAPAERMICLDCGSQDYLDNVELRKAVESAGRKFDILGCDACLMNMIEIAYEMKDTAQCFVGSEETEPGAGWPYTDILRPLIATPGMTAPDLAKLVVTSYGQWYSTNGSPTQDGSATQSACILAKVDSVANAVNSLAIELKKAIPDGLAPIALARSRTLEFEMSDYVDLGDFAMKIEKYLPGTPAAAKAGDVIKALKYVVIANTAWGDQVKGATGLSIFFPQGKTNLLHDYRNLKFTADHPGWCEFLTHYRAN